MTSNRPSYGQVGIVPDDAALVLGRPVVGGFVEEFSGIGEDDETMGESWWYPELPLVFSRKDFSDPFAEGWRTLADIDGHVEYLSGYCPDKFALWLLYLVMEAAKNIPLGSGVVVLHECGFEAGLLFP